MWHFRALLGIRFLEQVKAHVCSKQPRVYHTIYGGTLYRNFGKIQWTRRTHYLINSRWRVVIFAHPLSFCCSPLFSHCSERDSLSTALTAETAELVAVCSSAELTARCFRGNISLQTLIGSVLQAVTDVAPPWPYSSPSVRCPRARYSLQFSFSNTLIMGGGSWRWLLIWWLVWWAPTV